MEKVDQPKINRGIYSFLSARGHDISTMNVVLTLYAQTIDMKRPKKNRRQWYADVSKLAQKNFKDFKKVYFDNKKNLVVSQSYEDWWQESNMDGSFAYNGVTDDF